MASEKYIFNVLTESPSGFKWSYQFFCQIEEVENNQIRLYGKVDEEGRFKLFKDALSPSIKKMMYVNEVNVDYKLLYTLLREWYDSLKTMSS